MNDRVCLLSEAEFKCGVMRVCEGNAENDKGRPAMGNALSAIFSFLEKIDFMTEWIL